jgi:myb proto-oncogene protein
LNRGIDPETHRPLNEPAQEALTTICKEEKTPVQERCPDLSLELRISLPKPSLIITSHSKLKEVQVFVMLAV